MEKKNLNGLNKFNLIMSALHLMQGIAVLLLSSTTKGVDTTTISYLKFDYLTQKLIPATHNLFNLNLSYIVAVFFFLSAGAHFFIGTVYRKSYEKNLIQGINKVRWIEYSLSASVMMIGIALLSGIYDISSLIMIFSLDVVMNLMGLAMEVYNTNKDKINWLLYKIGCFAGIIPWVIFVIYVYGARTYGGGNIPSFVYWIYFSIFIFFNSFAINMYLQYKKIGPWKNYLFGEKVYIILSLVAKSLLAWQVFAGTLRP